MLYPRVYYTTALVSYLLWSTNNTRFVWILRWRKYIIWFMAYQAFPLSLCVKCMFVHLLKWMIKSFPFFPVSISIYFCFISFNDVILRNLYPLRIFLLHLRNSITIIFILTLKTEIYHLIFISLIKSLGKCLFL